MSMVGWNAMDAATRSTAADEGRNYDAVAISLHCGSEV
jgi:hypothetical protein